jgi:hypothetical protein
LIGKLVNSGRITRHNRIVLFIGIFVTHATMVFLASSFVNPPTWVAQHMHWFFFAWMACVVCMYCIWSKGMRVRRSKQSAVLARITLCAEFGFLILSVGVLCLLIRS